MFLSLPPSLFLSVSVSVEQAYRTTRFIRLRYMYIFFYKIKYKNSFETFIFPALGLLSSAVSHNFHHNCQWILILLVVCVNTHLSTLFSFYFHFCKISSFFAQMYDHLRMQGKHFSFLYKFWHAVNSLTAFLDFFHPKWHDDGVGLGEVLVVEIEGHFFIFVCVFFHLKLGKNRPAGISSFTHFDWFICLYIKGVLLAMDVVANLLDCDIIVREFELHKHYCIHFRTNTQLNLLILPAMG